MAEVTKDRLRAGVVLAILVGSLVGVLSLGPIAQDLAYHRFADDRTVLGVANFADVVSNLPFLLVGAWALARSRRWVVGAERPAWLVLFAGVALVSAGSAYYHLAPDNGTLVWDRLPMTVGFTGLLVALLGEHMGAAVVRRGLAPAVVVGAATVVYWHFTDDLRPYVWVQLAPLLAIPTVLLVYRTPYTHTTYLWLGLAFYAAAKLAEVQDAAIFEITHGVVSGHTLKHLLAALGPACIYRMLVVRRRRGAIAGDRGAFSGPGQAAAATAYRGRG